MKVSIDYPWDAGRLTPIITFPYLSSRIEVATDKLDDYELDWLEIKYPKSGEGEIGPVEQAIEEVMTPRGEQIVSY